MQQRTRRIAIAILVGGLTVALAVAVYLAVTYHAALQEAERRELDTQNNYTNLVNEYALGMPSILTAVRTLEPPRRLGAADVGLYSARIVGTSGKYDLTFDWTGIDPNPHKNGMSNERRVQQTLRPSPLGRVYLWGPVSPDDPEVEGLRPVGGKELIQMLGARDATSAALLDSDWLVSVTGPEYSAVIQLP